MIQIFVLALAWQLVAHGPSQGPVHISGISQPLYFGGTAPVKFTNSAKSFLIEAPANTDMYRAADHSYAICNAPFLYFILKEDFVLSAKLTVHFKQKWDAGAMVLESDTLHYIKFGFERDYTLKNRVVSVATQPYSDDCNSMELNSSVIFYRMAKNGDMILLYESADGRSWFLVRELNFPAKGSLKLGFIAQSPAGKGCSVTFSDISYNTRKITDPYNPQ
jgi:regulation of enolase protein 1 (concanavalin A-like superfamily)